MMNRVMLWACSRLTRSESSSFAVEAIAVIHDLRLALDLGFQFLILKGDSKIVISKIKDIRVDLSEISALTWEAKELAKAFQVCIFQPIDQSGNKVAHALVWDSLRRDKDRFWVEEVSESVVTVVEEDRHFIDPP